MPFNFIQFLLFLLNSMRLIGTGEYTKDFNKQKVI